MSVQHYLGDRLAYPHKSVLAVDLLRSSSRIYLRPDLAGLYDGLRSPSHD